MKTESQIEELNLRIEKARAAYAAANREAVEALRDAMGGLRYIESEHGRLYGVGWDRVYAKADAAYAAYEAARKINMTKEQLEEILAKVWMRDWSADDASDAIWGETFSDTTPPAPPSTPPSAKPKSK